MSAPPTNLSPGDYAVFGLALGISAVIGVFYGIKDRNANEEEYNMGGRRVGMVPVAFSLSVSFMSAVTVLGTPAEVYRFGTMYWWYLLPLLMVAVITGEVFIPVFYRMGISSTYEYLERRFNRVIRLLGTLTFIIQTTLYVGIVMYAPALALSQVTELDLWTAVITCGVVCIFYTTLGGLKAVIWTDVFQALVMLAGFLSVVIKGSADAGGFSKAWQTCAEHGRIDFNHFEFDPRIRHTFWTITVGGTFIWLGAFGVSQSMVQRYLSCKTIKQAKCALYFSWVGVVIIISLCVVMGVLVFNHYSDCDPLITGDVSAADQLLPFYALDIFRDLPGLTGLVISCIFSGSLSTVSSAVNAMACVLVEDFIKPYSNWKDDTYKWLSKITTVIFGGLCLAMAYLASQLGSVLEASLSIVGLVGGPLVGLFSMAFAFPFINSLGAGCGLVSGIIFSFWVYLGGKTVGRNMEFNRLLNFSVSGSNCNYTMLEPTAHNVSQIELTPIVNLYSISYTYYSCLGFIGVLVVGIIVSLASCGWRGCSDQDPMLFFFPLDHWVFSSWLPETYRKWWRCGIEPVPQNEYPESTRYGKGRKFRSSTSRM